MEAVARLERRLKRRVSQVELAARWKTSQGSVSRYFDGKGIPERTALKRIAADCGVDPGWLDYGTQPAKPAPPADGDDDAEAADRA